MAYRDVDKKRAARRRAYLKGREAELAYQKAAREANPEVFRDRQYRFQYGVSFQDFVDMLASQGGTCAICGDDLVVLDGNTVLDHDHQIDEKRGAPRGVLCRGCNLMLGYAKDSPERLKRAIEYLERT